MIKTYRQWQIMSEYQSPEEADYNEAYELFYEDLCKYFYECVKVEEA